MTVSRLECKAVAVGPPQGPVLATVDATVPTTFVSANGFSAARATPFRKVTVIPITAP